MLIRTTRTTTGTAIRATCAFATSRDRSVSPPPTITVEKPVRTKRRLYTRSYTHRHKPIVFYTPCRSLSQCSIQYDYIAAPCEFGRFLRGTPCFIHNLISLTPRSDEQEMATNLLKGDGIRHPDVEAHLSIEALQRRVFASLL